MISRDARRIAVVAFPDAQLLDICGPLEVFSRASRVISDEGRRRPEVYAVELLAHRAGPMRTSSGLALLAARSFKSVRDGLDTLMVAGGRGTSEALRDRALIDWLRRVAPRVRRLASVCTGTFLLAEAGLLDGKRVTTHWEYCEKLAADYPRLTVDPDPIFIRQGSLYTTAGVTSGMDLALALVAEDYGTAVSRTVARELVLFLQRPGGQAQFSTQLQIQSADNSPLADLQAWMADHLDADLSISALARRAAMSPRNFARIFLKSFGVTPARLVHRMRVEAARRRLEESDEGVKAIAAECGFGTPEAMRRAFVRSVRVPPSAYRSRFSQALNGAAPRESGEVSSYR